MKVLFNCVLLAIIVMIMLNINQAFAVCVSGQPGIPPSTSCEEIVGDVTCIATKTFGQNEYVSIQAPASADLNKVNIPACVEKAKVQLKNTFKPTNLHNNRDKM